MESQVNNVERPEIARSHLTARIEKVLMFEGTKTLTDLVASRCKANISQGDGGQHEDHGEERSGRFVNLK